MVSKTTNQSNAGLLAFLPLLTALAACSPCDVDVAALTGTVFDQDGETIGSMELVVDLESTAPVGDGGHYFEGGTMYFDDPDIGTCTFDTGGSTSHGCYASKVWEYLGCDGDGLPSGTRVGHDDGIVEGLLDSGTGEGTWELDNGDSGAWEIGLGD